MDDSIRTFTGFLTAGSSPGGLVHEGLGDTLNTLDGNWDAVLAVLAFAAVPDNCKKNGGLEVV